MSPRPRITQVTYITESIYSVQAINAELKIKITVTTLRIRSKISLCSYRVLTFSE